MALSTSEHLLIMMMRAYDDADIAHIIRSLRLICPRRRWIAHENVIRTALRWQLYAFHYQ